MKSLPDRPRATARRRILIVDDHPMTRYGVTMRIRAESDLEVCSEHGNVTSALAALQHESPDLVLLDLSLGERSGMEFLKDVKILHPRLPVLVFSMHSEALYAERVLRAGARGYVMKSQGAEKLIEAIRQVLRGEVCFSPSTLAQVLTRLTGGSDVPGAEVTAILSDRELEIFQFIGQGLETRQIAGRLRLSISTVETHRAHIKQKLGIASPSQLVRAAVEWLAGRQVQP